MIIIRMRYKYIIYILDKKNFSDFIGGNDMKKLMSGYLNVLYSFEPKSVGGKLPPDDFYVIVD